jgi:hypothetical protein
MPNKGSLDGYEKSSKKEEELVRVRKEIKDRKRE